MLLILFSSRESSIPGSSALTEVVAEIEFKESRESPIKELVKGFSSTDTVMPGSLVVAAAIGKTYVCTYLLL